MGGGLVDIFDTDFWKKISNVENVKTNVETNSDGNGGR